MLIIMENKDIKCLACEDFQEALSQEEQLKNLQKLNKINENFNWCIKNNTLCLDRKFKNFKLSFYFIQKISEISENVKHHPDLSFGWGYCSIKIITHKINNLTEFDFKLAELISEIDKTSI